MTERGHLRDELRRLGNAPVPLLDSVRSERLERRVLGAALPRELVLVDDESIDGRRPGRRIAAVISLAAACLLAVAVVGSLDRTREPDRILSTSGDVEVVLPDGSVVDGTTGMVVPDGAILRLGSDGEAEVDGITISGAGDYLVTRDGLTLLTTTNPPASTRPTDRPPATRPPSSDPDEPAVVAADAPSDSTVPRSTEPDPAPNVVTPTTTPTTDQRPGDDRRPADDDSQRVAPPPVASMDPRVTAPSTSSVPDTTPPTSRTDPRSDAPALLDVTIRTDGRRVGFAWRAVAGAAGYMVAAGPAGTDGGGAWPPGPGFEITELGAGTLQHSVSRPAEGSWSYRVAAVGSDGRTLALSRVITIES